MCTAAYLLDAGFIVMGRDSDKSYLLLPAGNIGAVLHCWLEDYDPLSVTQINHLDCGTRGFFFTHTQCPCGVSLCGWDMVMYEPTLKRFLHPACHVSCVSALRKFSQHVFP